LHNLLRDRYSETVEHHYYNYDPNDSPTNNLVNLQHTGGFSHIEGFVVRNEFKTFFTSPEGEAVPWQDNQTSRTDNA